MYYSNIYTLLSVPETIPNYNQSVKMILFNKSKSTKPVVKPANDVALLPKEDVLMWVLKRNAK